MESIRDAFEGLDRRRIAEIDQSLASNDLPLESKPQLLLTRASMLMYGGDTVAAYEVLQQARDLVKSSDRLAEEWLYTIIFFQGVAGLRRGETRTAWSAAARAPASSPFGPRPSTPSPTGSRLAIRHFTEYLEQFPDDLGVRWLLNLAYMTLGEHPAKVPRQYLLTFDDFGTEFDIGRFQDIGHLVGVNRFNQAGGAIMDDFDNDGLLDIVVTTWDAGQAMAFYRNKGDGTFEDRTEAAGLEQAVRRPQPGPDRLQQRRLPGHLRHARAAGCRTRCGRACCATTATAPSPTSPSEAGLMDPVNSICATWADFDNDGFLDLFICCETRPQPPVPQSRATAPSRKWRPRPASRASKRSARGPPGSTTTTTAIPTCS